MGNRNFKKLATEIVALAPRQGSCLATDKITVSGLPVGYMYREEPYDEYDSGWRFFAGDESQDYLDNANNLEIYDVNTIANYDPDIIPFLGGRVGSAFERNPSGAFVVIDE